MLTSVDRFVCLYLNVRIEVVRTEHPSLGFPRLCDGHLCRLQYESLELPFVELFQVVEQWESCTQLAESQDQKRGHYRIAVVPSEARHSMIQLRVALIHLHVRIELG